MNIAGHTLNPGDEITLTRGKNRVTVEYSRDIRESPDNGVVGFQDTTSQLWYTHSLYTHSSYSFSWNIAGFSEYIAPEPEAVPLPEREGFYFVLDSETGDELVYFVIELTPEGFYESGSLNNKLSDETVRALTILEPLYMAGEHFTAISSDGVTIYNILRTDGSLTCECKGFEYRQSCRHIEAYAGPVKALGSTIA